MNKRDRNGAFTLVEILVVVLIISMLAAFVAPRFFKGLGQTKRQIARSKMAIIEDSLGRFYLASQRFPDDTEGLESLISMPSDIDEDKWTGPYLKKSELLDPWGNPYLYIAEGQVNPGSYDLVSYGADGTPGGQAENEDIYND